MAMRKQLVALLATIACLLFVGTASAAFPNFSDCPLRERGNGCIDIKNTSGNLNIKGFNVPLHESLEIRGGLRATEEGNTFVAPTGTNGFFATPVAIPGGLLGIEFPIPGNSVLAITELAGAPSSIHIEVGDQSIRMPVRVRLINALLGMNCHIGTSSRPVTLTLITGTTEPPAPNRPISGRTGAFSAEGTAEGDIIVRFAGNVNVENSFSVPGATECGLGLGLINALVNAKLRIPSAGGNNSIEVTNNVALKAIEH